MPFCINCFQTYNPKMVKFAFRDDEAFDLLKFEQFVKYTEEVPTPSSPIFRQDVVSPFKFSEAAQVKWGKYIVELSGNHHLVCGYCHFPIYVDDLKSKSNVVLILATSKKLQEIEQIISLTKFNNYNSLFLNMQNENKNIRFIILPFKMDNEIGELKNSLISRAINQVDKIKIFIEQQEDNQKGFVKNHKLSQLIEEQIFDQMIAVKPLEVYINLSEGLTLDDYFKKNKSSRALTIKEVNYLTYDNLEFCIKNLFD